MASNRGGGKVTPIAKQHVLLSISQLATETQRTRETVAKRLSESGIRPAGERRGYPVYRLRDALPAIYAGMDGEDVDPDRLKPFERHAHYKAEHEKLRLQVERSELVPAIEVEEGEAEIIKLFVQSVTTLPDLLERDCGATPMQLARIERHLNEMREALYQKLTEEADADSAAADRA